MSDQALAGVLYITAKERNRALERAEKAEAENARLKRDVADWQDKHDLALGEMSHWKALAEKGRVAWISVGVMGDRMVCQAEDGTLKRVVPQELTFTTPTGKSTVTLYRLEDMES